MLDHLDPYLQPLPRPEPQPQALAPAPALASPQLPALTPSLTPALNSRPNSRPAPRPNSKQVCIGLTPFVDNFMHMGGLLAGLVIGGMLFSKKHPDAHGVLRYDK